MAGIHATRVLTAQGWIENARLVLLGGHIAEMASGAPEPGDIRVDTLLPAPGNLHSHCFQRAMAGMTERRAADRDNFWSWRDLMYRFVGQMTPGQFQAIAAQGYVEMMEAGYASVGEFHYVHHRPDGGRYDDPAELSLAVFAAASDTGIGLTHLPVLYTYGGAGRRPLAPGQLRFANGPDGFADLVQAVRRAAAAMPADTRVGIAPHSLRATCPDDLTAVLGLAAGAPVHMHIAEQPAEVAQIRNWLGARPVEWALDHLPVGADWCLIHATHMTAGETDAMARSGAVAGLCPITEANLGDGPFNGAEYMARGGAFGVGTDSNVRISLAGELRMLEYSQRLRDLARNVLAIGDMSVGTALFCGAARGAAQALGRGGGQIEIGALADLMAIDSNDTALCALRTDQLLDGFCFAGGRGVVTDVWAAGRHSVRGRRHVARDRIERDFRDAMRALVRDV
ncbi:MAG: formimidoylglutamate deiminase [Rhodobacteraceae bacterium]|nr:formimidoylglutamate deiminase [Paracoccaceae bacterium]